MSLVNLIEFNPIGDERGNLISIESEKSVPFNIKRAYYLYSLNSSLPRGFHAHKNLEQVAICIAGSCKIILDDGKQREEVELSSPAQGLHIKSMIWREMGSFSNDCILLVLANEYYQEDDYIRDYSDFVSAVKLDS